MSLVEEHTPRAVVHLIPISVARAEGALITDVDGNTFIDFAGGIGAMNSGHRADRVVEAIKEQADQYLHLCFMVTLYEPYVELARKLNEIVPGSFPKKTILFNSGSEAVDNAMKIARVATGRRAIIAFDRAFHGRTMGAVSLTGQARPYRTGMGPFVPEIYHAPAPYSYRCDSCGESTCATHSPRILLEMFRSEVAAEEVAAIIAEPVLGEGGFIVPPLGYFRELKQICEENGILFIADEVQTGFGRTGRMFAIEHFGVAPDITITAKSLSGGTPLSAITGRAEVMDSAPVGSLGGTYGGNPLACRAALAAIETIERENLLPRSEQIGRRLAQAFAAWRDKYRLIGDVRGLGAMMAMELVIDSVTKEPAREATAAVIKHCYEQGLIVMRAGAAANVIRTLMPLAITDEQLEEGLTILEGAIAAAS
jgi:4-aminobutyrate aminotransferase/(S)-3-amino-2-methylpropionate transaminase